MPTRRKKKSPKDSVEPAKNPLEEKTTLFLGQILALRELAGVVTSHVLPLDDPPTHDALKAFMEALYEGRELSVNGVEASTDDKNSTRDEQDTEPYRLEANPEGGGVKFFVPSPEAADALLVVLKESRKRFGIAARAPLMRRSLLAMAVSSFEALIGNLIEENLRRHNSALGSSDKEFSLDDLLRFSNLQEAVEDLMSRRIEDFTRRSVRDWQRWFERNMSIRFEDLVPDWEHANEIFERRNLVMHSDCHVTGQYLSQVDPRFTADIKRGDVLEVDDEYLDSALDDVLTLGLLLGFRVWIKLAKKETQRAVEWLSDHQVELMNEERWLPSMMISQVVTDLPIKEVTALDFKVNGWHAKKALRGMSEIEELVRTWDTSALTTRYKLAKSLLLDEDEAAVALQNVIQWRKGLTMHCLNGGRSSRIFGTKALSRSYWGGKWVGRSGK